ncbi:MAG: hypothetical protein QM504_08510 [Pseudomonadota bacterium]
MSNSEEKIERLIEVVVLLTEEQIEAAELIGKDGDLSDGVATAIVFYTDNCFI